MPEDMKASPIVFPEELSSRGVQAVSLNLSPHDMELGGVQGIPCLVIESLVNPLQEAGAQK